LLDKKQLSERDICTKYITPALKSAGWNIKTQIREEVTFTDDKIIVRGEFVKRGKRKRIEYIRYHKSHLPIAIIEAKDNNHTVGAGIRQALDSADILNIPLVFSSNGDAFLEHDSTRKESIEKEISLDSFPSPEELWRRYKQWNNISDDNERIIEENYSYDSGNKPRYYKSVAINRIVKSITNGRNKILLVMATSTGKTFTAFQITWTLLKLGLKKRILFLVDRNILVDQTMTNNFKQFGDKMKKITNRHIDESYEIYLTLYQAVTGKEEWKNIYKSTAKSFNGNHSSGKIRPTSSQRTKAYSKKKLN